MKQPVRSTHTPLIQAAEAAAKGRVAPVVPRAGEVTQGIKNAGAAGPPDSAVADEKRIAKLCELAIVEFLAKQEELKTMLAGKMVTCPLCYGMGQSRVAADNVLKDGKKDSRLCSGTGLNCLHTSAHRFPTSRLITPGESETMRVVFFKRFLVSGSLSPTVHWSTFAV